MKATVVQIDGKYAVLLQEDGSFMKMKTMNLKIGDVVNKKDKNVLNMKKFSSMIAAALFAALLGGGVYTYGTPSYNVSLDVNPGIMMEVNMFNRVIGLEAANADAEEVLNGLELENKDIEDAIVQAVERISDLGYFDEKGGNILISTTARNEKNAIQAAEKLETKVKEEIEENEMDVEVTSKVIGYEMVEAARKLEGMTPGKYNLIVNLLKVAPEEVADYKETSIKNIMMMFTESKKKDKKIQSEEASDSTQNQEVDEKSPENGEFEGKDRTELPVQADLKENNAPIDTPASNSNTDQANSVKNAADKSSEDNVNQDKPASENKKEAPEKPGNTDKPETPGIDAGKEKPEIPRDSDSDTEEEKEETEETESKDQEGQGNRKPETPKGQRP